MSVQQSMPQFGNLQMNNNQFFHQLTAAKYLENWYILLQCNHKWLIQQSITYSQSGWQTDRTKTNIENFLNTQWVSE